MSFLTFDDLIVFQPDIDKAKAQAMIDDATARALLVAPCIGDEDFTRADVVKAILRQAILRWYDTGSGAMQSQTAGPFGVTLDTRQERRSGFFPSEITELQSLCSVIGGSVYTTSLAGPDPGDGYWSQPNTWVPIP